MQSVGVRRMTKVVLPAYVEQNRRLREVVEQPGSTRLTDWASTGADFAPRATEHWEYPALPMASR